MLEFVDAEIRQNKFTHLINREDTMSDKVAQNGNKNQGNSIEVNAVILLLEK